MDLTASPESGSESSEAREAGRTESRADVGRARRRRAPRSLREGRTARADRWGGAAVDAGPGPDEADAPTTLVLKNMPQETGRADLCSLLDARGFWGRYDFVYAPTMFKTMTPFGYAFANFVDHESARLALQQLRGLLWTVGASSSTLQAEWSSPHQGLQAHVARFRNCPVMHPSVPDAYKPIILQSGCRVPFPMPTETLSLPREFRKGLEAHLARFCESPATRTSAPQTHKPQWGGRLPAKAPSAAREYRGRGRPAGKA